MPIQFIEGVLVAVASLHARYHLTIAITRRFSFETASSVTFLLEISNVMLLCVCRAKSKRCQISMEKLRSFCKTNVLKISLVILFG